MGVRAKEEVKETHVSRSLLSDKSDLNSGSGSVLASQSQSQSRSRSRSRSESGSELTSKPN